MKYRCVLCKENFEGYGNNADPIAKGLCCNRCNIKVITVRLYNMREQQNV